MYYINAISSISHQDSFRNDNVNAGLKKLEGDHTLVSPDYKEFIPRNALRRLSPILRMGLTCSIECSNKIGKEFDSIIVGTALGCLKDTEKFLTTYITSTNSILSPTPFIQSTHNTIGGQISLGLENHAYNMTHTQNNLSFEVSLIDAILCLEDGKNNVLVGAAEEKIDFLEIIQPDLITDEYSLTSGSSFFTLSNDCSTDKIGIKAVDVQFNNSDTKQAVLSFLKDKNIPMESIDIIYNSGNHKDYTSLQKETINFLDYTGIHLSASAFAAHMAHDYIKHSSARRALVINDICKGKLGLMVIDQE